MIVAETTGVTLAQADEVRRALGTPQGQQRGRGVVAAGGGGPRLRARRRRPDLGGAQGVRLASGSARPTPRPSRCRPTSRPGSRPTTRRPSSPGCSPTTPACTPSGCILDDARSLRHRGARPRRQRLAPAPTASSGSTTVPAGRRHPRIPDQDRRRARRRRTPTCPTRSAYGIRLSLADVKGISEAEVARIVAGQPYASLADFWHRAQVSPARSPSGSCSPAAFDSPLRHEARSRRAGWAGAAGSPGATCCCTSPSSTGGRASAALAGGAAQQPAARHRRASRLVARAVGRHRAAGDVAGPRGRAVPGGPPVVPAAEQPTQLTLDLGDTPELAAATGLPEMTGPERVRAELDMLGLDASAHVVDFYAPDAARARGDPQPRPARRPAAARGAGRRGQGRHPDPADPLRAPGRLPHPRRLHRAGRRHLLRGRPGPLCRDRLPLLDAAVPRGGAPHRRRGASRCGRPAPGSSPRCGTPGPAGGLDAVRAAIDAGRGERRRPSAQAAEEAAAAARRPAGSRAAGGCSSTPRGSSSRPTPTPPAGGDVRGARGLAPGQCVPDRTVALPAAQAVARQPRKLRALGWDPHCSGAARHGRPRATDGGAAVPDEQRRAPTRRASETVAAHLGGLGRCARPRRPTAAPTSAGRCGCSTSAVAPAASPSRSPRPATTSPSSTPAPTPSPRWPAAAAEAGIAERITAVQGDADTLGDRRCGGAAASTWSAATAPSRSSTTPQATLATHRRRARSRRAPSRLVAAQRLAVVLARALAGQFAQARAALVSARRPLGRRRPAAAAVRRASARATCSPPPGFTDGRLPRRAHLQRPRALGPHRLRGRPRSPCSSSSDAAQPPAPDARAFLARPRRCAAPTSPCRRPPTRRDASPAGADR